MRDRISRLPKEIIHRILSHLDAREVVQTCVLNKRWKDLWASVPVLNLNDSSFGSSVCFECFLDNFLSCRDDSTTVFEVSLVCHHDLDDGSVVESIIDYVTETSTVFNTIQALTISAETVAVNLSDLSICRSLTTLKLMSIATEMITFNIPSLRHLYLYGCRFECGSGEPIDAFSECVNLKCLHFHNCTYYGDVPKFKIVAPELTDLSISCLRVDELFDSETVIKLYTPKLEYFKYYDPDLYYISSKFDLSCLEEVHIDAGWLTKETDFLYRLIGLFEIMRNAEFVTLSTDVIRVLSLFPDILDGRSPPFTRVETFEIVQDSSSPFVMPPNVKNYLFGKPH